MRKRIYGPKVFTESYEEYISNIMKRHESFKKELSELEKKIEENNKSTSEALDELDALFN